MLRQVMARAATWVTLSTLAVVGAELCEPSAAVAVGDQLNAPIVITPTNGCGLLTAYTAGTQLPAWSSPAPPCGTAAFTLAFNPGSTAPLATGSPGGGVGMAGSALLAWSSSVPQGARMGYRITAPPGITISNVVYDIAHLQNIANGYGWIGLTYWNGGTAQVLSPGTAMDAAAAGPLNTNYWGIELRCVQSVCEWPAKIQLNQIEVYATEAQRPRIAPTTDPTSLCDRAGQWVWNAPGNVWPLPLSASDSSGVCSLSVQIGASAPVADSSLPAANNSSWQECQQQVG